jgi:hypothetical protein
MVQYIRYMTIAIQIILINDSIVNSEPKDTINEIIKRRTLSFENHMNSIIRNFEGNPMAYKSIAPHLNMSCYNCQFFRMGVNMLQGICERKNHPTSTVCGIGTCDEFTSMTTKER